MHVDALMVFCNPVLLQCYVIGAFMVYALYCLIVMADNMTVKIEAESNAKVLDDIVVTGEVIDSDDVPMKISGNALLAISGDDGLKHMVYEAHGARLLKSTDGGKGRTRGEVTDITVTSV